MYSIGIVLIIKSILINVLNGLLKNGYLISINIGLKSYHWGGGSKTLESLITKMELEKYIVEPEFAFPINWWDFKHAFLDTTYIPPSRGWTECTNIDDIFKKANEKGIYLVVIHNGWMKNHNIDKNATYPENSLFEKLDRFINS